MKPKLKVCGMKYNVEEVATLGPDYLGFIFYEPSPRHYTGPNVFVPETIRKVGVFVNESMEMIITKVKEHALSVIQLHGDEDVIFVEELRAILDFIALENLVIWKVFNVGESFNFNQLLDYEPHVEAFLFDSYSNQRGGSGKTFNWDLLKQYPLKKPIVLSGGIGPDAIMTLKDILGEETLPIYAIDVNSKFEIEPGRKDIAALKNFMDEL